MEHRHGDGGEGGTAIVGSEAGWIPTSAPTVVVRTSCDRLDPSTKGSTLASVEPLAAPPSQHSPDSIPRTSSTTQLGKSSYAYIAACSADSLGLPEPGIPAKASQSTGAMPAGMMDSWLPLTRQRSQPEFQRSRSSEPAAPGSTHTNAAPFFVSPPRHNSPDLISRTRSPIQRGKPFRSHIASCSTDLVGPAGPDNPASSSQSTGAMPAATPDSWSPLSRQRSYPEPEKSRRALLDMGGRIMLGTDLLLSSGERSPLEGPPSQCSPQGSPDVPLHAPGPPMPGPVTYGVASVPSACNFATPTLIARPGDGTPNRPQRQISPTRPRSPIRSPGGAIVMRQVLSPGDILGVAGTAAPRRFLSNAPVAAKDSLRPKVVRLRSQA